MPDTEKAKKAPMTKVKLKKTLPRSLKVRGEEVAGGTEIEVTKNQSARLFEAGFLEGS